MANLNAVSTAANTSADITLAAGASTTLSLSTGTTGVGVPYGASASIQIRSAGATYMPIGVLDAGNPIKVLTAVGTFRVVKSAAAVAFGVERD